jgi:uncharacterized protein (TIGR03067 family)
VNPVLLGLAVAVGAPALKEAPKPESPLLGEWALVEWLQNGQPVGVPAGSGGRFLAGGKRVWRDGSGEPEDRAYKLIPKTSPAQLDLIRNQDGPSPIVHPCIFKVDGDTLTIAVGEPGGDRPTTFDKSAYMLMTLTRVKAKD